jgi:hypothetical protein
VSHDPADTQGRFNLARYFVQHRQVAWALLVSMLAWGVAGYAVCEAQGSRHPGARRAGGLPVAGDHRRPRGGARHAEDRGGRCRQLEDREDRVDLPRRRVRRPRAPPRQHRGYGPAVRGHRPARHEHPGSPGGRGPRHVGKRLRGHRGADAHRREPESRPGRAPHPRRGAAASDRAGPGLGDRSPARQPALLAPSTVRPPSSTAVRLARSASAAEGVAQEARPCPRPVASASIW